MADLRVCSECGGVEDCLDTCKWMAPTLARRAAEKRNQGDLARLERIRGAAKLPWLLDMLVHERGDYSAFLGNGPAPVTEAKHALLSDLIALLGKEASNG